MNQSKKLTLFSTQIFKTKCLSKRSKLFTELADATERLYAGDIEGAKWSSEHYKNGYTSYGSYDQIHLMTEPFLLLKNKIDQHVKNYIKMLGLDISLDNLFMSRFWVNVMPKGSYHAWHTHPLSVISGTFYLQLPKGASPIRFEDPRFMFFMTRPSLLNKTPKEQQNFYSLNPQEGDLVLFESWIKHEVPMATQTDPRISLSFNYDLKR